MAKLKFTSALRQWMARLEPPRACLHVAALVASVFSMSFAEAVGSDPTCVFTAPEKSFIWCTATNSTVTLPIIFPESANSAELAVTGINYSATYGNLAKGDFALALPAASSPGEENVYSLTLSFDDGTVRTARLGLIKGYAGGRAGTTRCLAPDTMSGWRRIDGNAVFPVPYGATAFSVAIEGGATIAESGLDGAAGWFALAMPAGRKATVSITNADGGLFEVPLQGIAPTVFVMR